MTDTQKQQIAVLRGKGESFTAISVALDISINTVKSYCRRNNLVPGYPVTVIPPPSTVPSNTCPHCGCSLLHIPGKKKKRFCSDTCRMAWWKAHPEVVNRKAIYHFSCPACGIAFESYGNAHRKYCSRACLAAARRVAHA